jgi:dTDP-D-glucose 4,6-dehydratase
MTLRAAGKKLEVIMLNPDGCNNEYTSSNKRLLDEISWFKPTKLEIAVEKLYKYYYDNQEIINIERLKQSR